MWEGSKVKGQKVKKRMLRGRWKRAIKVGRVEDKDKDKDEDDDEK
jgi:hypothetical protein